MSKFGNDRAFDGWTIVKCKWELPSFFDSRVNHASLMFLPVLMVSRLGNRCDNRDILLALVPNAWSWIGAVDSIGPEPMMITNPYTPVPFQQQFW